jgi:hypothetical protein
MPTHLGQSTETFSLRYPSTFVVHCPTGVRERKRVEDTNQLVHRVHTVFNPGFEHRNESNFYAYYNSGCPSWPIPLQSQKSTYSPVGTFFVREIRETAKTWNLRKEFQTWGGRTEACCLQRLLIRRNDFETSEERGWGNSTLRT